MKNKLGAYGAIAALLGSLLLLLPGPGTSYGQHALTGFPTADINDGRFIALAGTGLSTVAQAMSFSVGISAGQGNFTLEIFDGNLGGRWDVHDSAKTGVVRVDYFLYADPQKDGRGATIVASKRDSDFSDDAWGQLYSGPPHASARAASGNFFYRLSVAFSDQAQASNEVDGFKLRADGQTSIMPGGTFGFTGAPINIDITTGTPDPAPGSGRNQYNGDWQWFIYLPRSGSAVTLTDTDADYRLSPANPGNPPDDCSPGPACFAIAPDIQYTVSDSRGNALIANSAPSGDQETKTRTVTGTGVGFLDWHWRGVDAHNLVFVSSSQEIFGSSAEAPLTIDAAPPPAIGIDLEAASTIKGRVFEDRNCNGVLESEESRLAGVTVAIDSGGGWTARTVTGPDGQYEFAGLSRGRFAVSPVIPKWYAGTIPTTRDGISVDGSVLTIADGNDFGLVAPDACAPVPGTPSPTPPAGEPLPAWPPQGPARTWYLAEGNTRAGFDTWLLLSNPGSAPVTATLDLFPDVGSPVTGTYNILPEEQIQVSLSDLLRDAALGMIVSAGHPISVERIMFFSGTGWHRGTGSPILDTIWDVSMVDTRSGIESWVLVLNPNDRPANLTLAFSNDDGTTATHSLLVSPSSRLTIFMNSLLPECSGSARVDSDLPIVVETSTYWDGARAGVNSLATPGSRIP